MKKLVLVACCLLICLMATNAHAENSVVIQSKLTTAAVPCTVGVFITNDVAITGIVMPFETRNISGDGYYDSLSTNAVLWNLTTTGRLRNSPLGVADPDGAYPAANTTRSVFRDPNGSNACSGPTSSSYSAASIRAGKVSPDGFLLAAVSTGNPNAGEPITLDPGADPAGVPSMRFVFTSLLGNGCFIIDTACITPANHLVFVDENTQPVPPSFTPGLITVGSGSCAGPPPNTAPHAVCQAVQVVADGSCQGTATAAQVNNGSNDTEDGTNLILALNPAGPYVLGPNQVWLRVTDQGGLKDSCQATITVVDQTKPTISCPGTITVQCPANVPAPYADAAAFLAANGSLADNCSGFVLSNGATTSNAQTCPETRTRWYIVTDGAGNKDSCAQTIIIDDTLSPIITQCVNDTTIHLPNGTTSTQVLYSDASINDNCSSVNIAHLPLSNSTFNVGTTQVRLIASDLCGNADTCFFNVTIIEDAASNTPPDANCQNVNANATSTCDASVTAAQVNNGSTDAQDGSNLVLALHPAGPYPLGQTQVWLVVTDQGGLKDSCQSTITVTDVTKPSLGCPTGGTYSCAADVPAPYADLAAFIAAGGTASDFCDQDLVFAHVNTIVGGSIPCNETITRTYRVTDDGGNFQECDQVIHVHDSIPPVVTCAQGDTTVIVASGTPNVAVTFGTGTATDNCDQNVGVVCSPASGALFPVGPTVVSCIATDDCGNVDTCQFTITVQEQVTDAPPTALCSDRVVSADSNCQANANINNGSFDPDGGSVTVIQDPAGPYALGTTLVHLTVTDDEGDTDTCSANVTVNDVTPPVVSCPGDIEMNNDPDQCGALYIGKFPTPSAVDNCSQNIKIIQIPDYGSFFPVGTTKDTVIAMDEAGNADTCVFNITVNDTEKPKVNCPDDIEVSNDSGQCGAIVNFVANATDNCPGVDVTTSQSTNTMFPVGTTTVWTVAVDKAGNKDSCSFTITVNDTEAPVVTCSGDIVVNAPFGAPGTNVNWNTSATDNCPGWSLDCNSNPNSFFEIGGPYTVCCTATDKAGNTDSCCFTITVLPGSPNLAGPHSETDTLNIKVMCGCDSSQIDIYCVQPDIKGDSNQCFYNIQTTVPGVHASPSTGQGPTNIWIVGCRSDLPPGTNSGWVYLMNAPGQRSDSIWVNFEVNADEPGIDVKPDTLSFTYTGDIYNDKLCLPATISSTGCDESCWQLLGSTGDWVYVDPTGGTTPDEADICVTPCALQAGTYYYTLTFCPCPKSGQDVVGCDQLVVKLTVVNPPVMVVDPITVLFEDSCGQKSNPLPIAITNAGGGVLDWHAFETASWFGITPEDGTAPGDTLWVYLDSDLECPKVCDTLVDSICVIGNKLCAINGKQWVTVTLILCPPPETGDCDSLCGIVYDSDCEQKGNICTLDGAHVQLWSSFPDGVIIDSAITDGDGHFCFGVTPGQSYDIRVYKKGYCTDTLDNWSCEDGLLTIDLDPLDFVPLPNWPYFTDYFSVAATNEGFPILPGDVIYATDPQGVICGICWVTTDGTYLIHVLGDDPKTGVDEGAVPGDSIQLWLNCKCPVTAPDTWANFGSYQFDAAWDCRPTGQCCVLCEGWNMWSFNIQVPSTLREDVLATIDLNYDAVRSGLCDYGSISWFSNRPVNDLTDVTSNYGYDIHMLAEDTVCLEGPQVDPQTQIPLCSGWNYIPYLPTEMNSLTDALSSLSGNYSHIFTIQCGYGVESWDEVRPVQNNDLICMEPCKGYWIKMKSADTLIYPEDPQGCDFNAKIGSSSFSAHVTATPMVADYYAPVSNLNAGSTVSVRSSSGSLIGETMVGANGSFLIHVYGDVPGTSPVEGAVQGEELRFEVDGLAASAGSNVLWTDRDNQAIDLTVDEAGGSIPSEYSLLQNYPNPFNAGTVMPFTMKDASEWTLTVYNIMGQTVQTFNGFNAAGTVRVSWNGLDQNGATVSSGIYFYRVSTPAWAATKKMTLLK